MRILPNRMLTCLGWHTADDKVGGGGDCMTLAVSKASTSSSSLLASGIPLAPTIKFWPLSHLAAEAQADAEIATQGHSGRAAKAKVTSRGAERDQEDFFSGLLDIASGGEEEEDEIGDGTDDDDGSSSD